MEKTIKTKTKKPFIFYSRLYLQVLTGLKAVNIEQLLKIIRDVPGSVIYYHTHRFLQQHIYLNPEPPNDFAYWVSDVLGEDELAEMLASIDTVQFADIRSLREEIIKTIEQYIKKKPSVLKRRADEDEAFHFIKAVSFIFTTGHKAHDLSEFMEILKIITVDAIYFHVFEARLRLKQANENDFSYWIRTSVKNPELARKISQLDPYTHTIEDLRKTIIRLVESRLKK
ncbi:MAG: hypothetical protein KKB82_02440 [Candidatus Omnitrophica bacterium]|nr:hypothetical protein [Candidatus Omnitrophota bacterium]MBU1924766.1 hypothetical protein [Candidatus Omnitrophota bacterium]MBU2064060.1 hypothetical protein [Candidatus Omnitrophota bacterium]